VVPTSLGELRVREYGSRGSPVAICLHGSVRKTAIRHEWDYTAEALATSAELASKFHVLLPDLHHVPHSVTDASLAPALLELVKWARGSDGDINLLLGKSWGGGLAAGVAARLGTHVHKLVLVAPGRVKRANIKCPTALFYASDDPLFKGSSAVRAMLKNEILFHVAPQGGHRVLKSYAPLIVGLAKATGSEVVVSQPVSKRSESRSARIEVAPTSNHSEHSEDTAEQDDEELPGNSRMWLILLVPVLCGPFLGILLPLRRVCARAIQGRREASKIRSPEPTRVGAGVE